jgi:hypothetical protein
MEKRQRVESKVLTVMIYPIVLVAFCLLAVVILTTKVIPTIGSADPAGGPGIAVDHAAVDEPQQCPDELAGAVSDGGDGHPRHGRRGGSSAPSGGPFCATGSCCRCPCSGR